MSFESPDKARAYWRFWAEDARRAGSEIYAQLASRIALDAELIGIAAHAAKGQPHANMLLGAVHFLVLRGADHPLRDIYGVQDEGTSMELVRSGYSANFSLPTATRSSTWSKAA
ncbi:MAG: DUF2332 family protein [Alphaproteobacteria bacterium]|nr:DUF2332 family protein [Alphaproteobacteria bacterium]